MNQCSQCGLTAESPFTFCPQCGTRQLPNADGGLPGSILNGKYRVLTEIGAGTMGTVYLGEHVSLRKKIALKVLHKDLQVSDETLKRFQREGIAAGQVDHPNAIQIFDFDRTEDGRYFLAMEYVRGENLKQWLEREGSMAPDQAVALFRQLLGTLSEAHRHGIVHRDLKPENLMVVKGADDVLALKVLDFGLSKLVDRPVDVSLLTVSGRVMGTPLYMAPEQWHGGEADARTDLYSACLILYETLAGEQPFRGSNLTETLVKSTTEAPPSLLDLELRYPAPEALDELLQRGLAKVPEERFQSAAELLEDLEQVPLEVASARGKTRRRPRRKTGRRAAAARVPTGRGRSLRLPLGIGAGVAGAAVVALVLLNGGDPLAADSGAKLVSMKSAAGRSDEERGYLALLADARQALRDGNQASAFAAAAKATRMPCADAEGFAVRAAVYRSRSDLDTALADYREALELYPGYAVAEAGIGRILLQRDDEDGAEQRFRRAIELDENRPEGFAGLAAILIQRGEHRTARELLDRVVGRIPDAAELQLLRGQAQLALGELDEAVQSFVQAKRDAPALWQAVAGLGDAYLQKGNAEAARQQYRQALTVASGEAGLRVKLAELLLANREFAEAETVLGPVLQGEVQDGRVHVLDGLAAHGRGNVEDAVAALERGLAAGAEESAHVHLLLATLHFEAGRFEQAASFCDRAVLVEGEAGAGAYRVWGLALFRLQDYPAAAFRLEQAIRRDGRDPIARYTLGVLYKDYLQQPDDAVEQFRKYLELGGDDPKVAGWLRELER